jgi:tryptophanase
MFQPRTIIEPFRIKSVEPIRQTTREERIDALEAAHYNLFLLRARDVLIDLLTDSGTGAMSSRQWAAMMMGDESYAGADSWYRFQDAVQRITGLANVIPTHQGRAAERILFGAMVNAGDIVPNNTHFDTTRANVEARGATALDIPIPEGRKPGVSHPFKGNMDLDALERVLRDNPGRVPVVMMTVTNNSREHPRRPGHLPGRWCAPVSRCVPVRRKRVVHSRAGAGPRAGNTHADCPGDVCRGRRRHHEREEGRHGEHRRVSRGE